MALTSREPSTKFFGPNARVFPIVTPVTVNFQIHNLQPGAFWIPGSETALHALHVLPRWPGSYSFYLSNGDFSFWILWSPTLARINARSIVNGRFAFRLFLFPAVTRWGTNDLIIPTGNFSHHGTITISWNQG